MKKNVLIKIGERTETQRRIIPAIYDENSNIVTEETVEQYTVSIPIIESRNVEMTEEEIAEMQSQMPLIDYSEEVNNEIRKRYSVSQEFAILRQKDEKPEEYAEYYAYCEECKKNVKHSM